MAALNPSHLTLLGEFKGSVVTRLAITVSGSGATTAIVISGRASPFSEWKVLTDDAADYNKSSLVNGIAVSDGVSEFPCIPSGATGYVYIDASGYYDLKVEAAGPAGCVAVCGSEVNLSSATGAGTIGVTPVGNLTATDIQGAFAELDADLTTLGAAVGSVASDLGELEQAVASFPAPTPAYSLPTASPTVLGGVKVGTNLSIDADGVLSAASGGGAYSLPVASASTLGGVKVGSNLSVDAGGVLSAPAPYVLPVATDMVLGGIKAGAGVSIAADGTLSATGGGGGSGTVTSVNSVQPVSGNVTLTTSEVAEGTNLYFTDARVRQAVLSDLNVTLSGAVTTADTVRTAIGKLQNFQNSKNNNNGIPGLSGYRLQLRNDANTFTSTLRNVNTAARSYTLPDKDGTVAMTSDIAASGGWVLLGTIDANAVNTVDIDTLFTTTYDNYVILIDSLTFAANDTLHLRMKLNGTWITSVSYTVAGLQVTYSSSTVSGHADTAATDRPRISATGSGTGSFGSLDGTIWVNKPRRTPTGTNRHRVGFEVVSTNTSSAGLIKGVITSSDISGMLDGVRLFMFSGASTMTGTFKIYGITK